MSHEIMVQGTKTLAAKIHRWGTYSKSVAAVAGQFASGVAVDEILARKAADSLGRIGRGTSTIQRLTAADREHALQGQNALLAAIHRAETAPAPGMVKGPKSLGVGMAFWHASMSDPVYAAGSHFYAGMPVKQEVAQEALESLERLYARREASRLPAKDARQLAKVIRELRGCIESSSAPRENPHRSGSGSQVTLGGYVFYADERWMVDDVHGYPVKTVDLRRTIIIDPSRRYLDHAEFRRGVSVKAVEVWVEAEHGPRDNPSRKAIDHAFAGQLFSAGQRPTALAYLKGTITKSTARGLVAGKLRKSGR